MSAATSVGGIVGCAGVGHALAGVGGLLLPVAAAAGPAVLVVLDPGALAVGEAVLRLPARSGAECVEFCVECRLGFDEAATVVAHWLVASVWIL